MSTASPKVLIVDDEECLRELIGAFLNVLELESSQAGTLEEAQEILGREKIALAIVDVNLEPQDRCKDASEDRKSHVLVRMLLAAGIPVIRMTGTPTHLHPAYQPGGEFAPVGVLRKPFKLLELKQLVETALVQR